MRLINFIKHPETLIIKIGRHTRLIPNKMFLRANYRRIFGRRLDLLNPKTFNEKLQWLKLYEHKDVYTTMVDKNAVKGFVAERIGADHIIPTIGVYDSFNDIILNDLPNSFVMKCTHDSSSTIICKNKAEFDLVGAKRKITKKLNHNYYLDGREWPYKNVPRKIIVEEYIQDQNEGCLTDYKIYTFDGVPKLMMITVDRQSHQTKANYYDMDFNQLPFTWGYPECKKPIQMPVNFNLMKKYAEILAKGTKHLRVDFYEANGHLYFGELTFFDGGGLDKFDPEEWDYKLGELISLPVRSVQ